MSIISLADEPYLLLIGQIVYGVAYLEWSILGDLPQLKGIPEPIQLETLVGKTTGQIGRALTNNFSKIPDPNIKNWVKISGEKLSTISTKRNALFHARPATTPDNKQCLFRWTTESGQQYWIDNKYLTDLQKEIEEALTAINSLRILRR